MHPLAVGLRRPFDADTSRFTALDPLGEKGGDNDWYGYCLDDPINRADVWGLAVVAIPGGPFGVPVPPVAIPGTPENDEFTHGTINIINEIGDWLDNVLGDSDDQEDVDDDPNIFFKAHTKNSRKSSRPRHQAGQARQQEDQCREKKEKSGRYKGRSELDYPFDNGFAGNEAEDDEEDA